VKSATLATSPPRLAIMDFGRQCSGRVGPGELTPTEVTAERKKSGPAGGSNRRRAAGPRAEAV